ncbi:MAG: hypothetical protein C4547_13310 [Phycisphaerales bacterium]|nr:MAG: hypothetical protein C4547_13310 [Phycisphaerales bacterium]
MALEAELSFFNEHRDAWCAAHEGEFVLIKGTDSSFFRTDDEAYRCALNQWGEVPVFIRQVLREDPTEDPLSLIYGTLHAPP